MHVHDGGGLCLCPAGICWFHTRLRGMFQVSSPPRKEKEESVTPESTQVTGCALSPFRAIGALPSRIAVRTRNRQLTCPLALQHLRGSRALKGHHEPWQYTRAAANLLNANDARNHRVEVFQSVRFPGSCASIVLPYLSVQNRFIRIQPRSL